jgi:hypothetical protein
LIDKLNVVFFQLWLCRRPYLLEQRPINLIEAKIEARQLGIAAN